MRPLEQEMLRRAKRFFEELSKNPIYRELASGSLFDLQEEEEPLPVSMDPLTWMSELIDKEMELLELTKDYPHLHEKVREMARHILIAYYETISSRGGANA